jgi:hypothetical protein
VSAARRAQSTVQKPVVAPRATDSKRIAAAALGLALVTILIFLPVRHFEFVNYDDLEFVVENPYIAGGVTGRNLRWIVQNPYAATGGPVTCLSHLADVELFGLDGGKHHVTSLAIHAVNSALLLVVLWWMTGALGRSAFVSALFALHPLHVESVAWVAQRKDVISAFFWLLTMWAYAWYVRRPSAQRCAVMGFILTLGLMSKPMLVTVPSCSCWTSGRSGGFRSNERLGTGCVS